MHHVLTTQHTDSFSTKTTANEKSARNDRDTVVNCKTTL